ncbi:MFS transporter [Streptomyces sp. RM1]|uniref:MFS transporter n=1 Tax=Streptomyces misionensis TaxID=67331 RepID=UPI00396B8A41
MTQPTPPDTTTEVFSAPLRRLLPTLFLGNAALFSLYIGVGSVLLPTQVAGLDDDPVNKALNLSVVTGSAALVAALGQPAFGALSDHSRRRHPWIAGAAVTAAAAVTLMTSMGTLALLAIWWCGVSLLLNMYQASLTAVVPDRVPTDRRGLASAVVGAATPVAAIAGVVVAGRFEDNLSAGYLVLGLVLAVAGIVFVTVNRERRLPASDTGSLGQQWRSLVSALAHHDFRYAFLARAAIMFAYYLVFAYLLYILEDRVTLPDGVRPVDALTWVGGVAAVFMTAGTLLGGILADRLRRYRIFAVVAVVLMALALVAPYLSRSLAAMFCYAVLTGLGFGCFLAVDTAIVTLVLPDPDTAARDLAVLNIANAAPQTAGAFVAGLVVAAGGGDAAGYANLFAVSAIFTVLGGFAVRRIKGVQ